jgi:hypothetical protein
MRISDKKCLKCGSFLYVHIYLLACRPNTKNRQYYCRGCGKIYTRKQIEEGE